jgi:hypothetical protein
MGYSKDGSIWMVIFLIFVTHLSVSHVGIQQEIVTPQWIGYIIIDKTGIAGTFVSLLFITIIISFISYIIFTDHKYKILSIYAVLLIISLTYNISLIL